MITEHRTRVGATLSRWGIVAFGCAAGAVFAAAIALSGCQSPERQEPAEPSKEDPVVVLDPTEEVGDVDDLVSDNDEAVPSAEDLRDELNIIEDYRPEFSHGEKGAEYQRYIVLHDTESNADPQSIVGYWASSGNLVAAHFVVGKDGTIVQCVPLDEIAHHAGFGDTGHNVEFGVEDESRDDKLGTVPIGSWAADYGMNSYSVGIEMVHVGGSGEYPEAQLEALDRLIAYIDAYYGFESAICDHKAWRSGNSDTSPEFAEYLASYQASRTHDGSGLAGS